MFDQLASDVDTPIPRGHMEREVAVRLRLVDVRLPVEVPLDLIEIAGVDGEVEAQGRGRRLGAGGERNRRQEHHG